MFHRLIALAILMVVVAFPSALRAEDEVLPAGSYIIPMTTAEQGGVNVLRGYGLVYRLLEEGVRVKWVIAPGKAHDGTDVQVQSHVRGAAPATAVLRSYRGGPFVIAQEDVALAHPHVVAFQAAHGTAVHVSTEAATYPVERTLRFAPRIGVIADGRESISFDVLNAALIPTSGGGTWTSSSNPDLLTTAQIAGPDPVEIDGVLFDDELYPTFCHVGSMHSSSSVITTPVLREIRAMLQQPQTSVLAQCEAIETYEDNPHEGNFLTTTGLNTSGSPSTPLTYNAPANPLMQFDGVWDVRGGSVSGFRPQAAWLPGATPLLTGNNSVVGVAYRHIDNDPMAGRIVYLAGHRYRADRIAEIPGARVYLNAIFEARCADLTFSPDVLLGGSFEIDLFGEFDLDLDWVNIGNGFGRDGALVLDVPVGVDFLSASDGGDWDPGARTVSWTLGAVPVDDSRGRTARFAGTMGEHTFDASMSWRVGTNVDSVAWSDTVDITMDLDGDGCLDHEEVDDFGTDPTDPTDCGPCTQGTDTCDENATCENELGGNYSCTCNEGYAGDGFTCVLQDVVLQDSSGSIPSGRAGGVSHNLVGATTLGGASVDAAEIAYAVLDDGGVTGLAIDAEGDVVVPAGTPAGMWTAVARACSVAFPTQCDDATMTLDVGAAALALDANSGAVSSGHSGGNAGSFVAGATLDGGAAPIGDLTNLAVVSDAGSGATASSAGEIVVPPSTPAGTYTLTVRACEVLNPTNCQSAPFTLEVGVAELGLPDGSGAVASGRAGGNAGSMFAGATLDGSPASFSRLTGLAILDDAGSGATLSGSGNVIVPSGTPQGVYALTVQVCEALNPTNCRSATFSLDVGAASLVLPDSSGAVASGRVGGSAGSMVAGATLDGGPAALSDLTNLAILDDDSSGATLSSNGNVIVPPGTPQGSYALTVRACEALNPTNCRDATFSLDVGAGVLALAPNNGAVPSGRAGGNAGSFLAGATLDGDPAGPSDLDGFEVLSDDGLGVTLSGTGQVVVPPGTPEGTYDLLLRACEALNPSNCGSAPFTLDVGAATLLLADGSGSVASGAAGGSAGSFVSGATLDGSFAPAEDYTGLEIVDAADSGATLGADGEVLIPEGTPQGTYALQVRACEALNPTNCDTATYTVSVGAAVLVLSDSAGSIPSGRAGGDAGSFIGVATLDGNPAAANELTGPVVLGSAGTGATATSVGHITVPSGVPQGTYPLSVRVCEALNPSNCSTATFTLSVGAASLVLAPTSGSVSSGASGGSAGSILTGATLDGQPASASAYANLAILDDDGSGATLSAGGTVGVAPGTPAGSYTLAVRACEALNPTNCDTSTFTLTVGSGSFVLPDTSGSVASGNTGGNAGSAVSGATVDGDPVGPGELTDLSILDDDGTGATLSSAGQVLVPAGVAAGSYELVVRACEALNPTNCDTATFTLEVGSAALSLQDNLGEVPSGRAGGAAGNALTGATLDGSPVVASELTELAITDDPSGVDATLSGTGTVSVPPGTPAGSYALTVQACEALNPGNCAFATFTVEVGSAEMALAAPSGTVASGAQGGDAGNVFSGATLDGASAPLGDFAGAILTADPDGSGAAVAADGTVSVPPGTPAGSYVLSVQGCEALNPGNCATGSFTLTVGEASLVLPPGSGSVPSGNTGGVAGNALTGATLDGAPAAPGSLTDATLVQDGGIGATVDASGNITVPPGTPAGSYAVEVRACEALNPTNCRTTTFTVTVGTGELVLPDSSASVPSGNTGGVAGNVLAGATLDGVPAAPGQLLPPTLTDPDGTGVTVDADGTLTVPPGTPSGSYTLLVSVCEALNPTNCHTAAVSLSVGAGELVVPPLSGDVPSGNLGGPAGNVLDGATLDGAPVGPGDVTGLAVLDDDGTSATLAPDGTLTVPSGLPAGTYVVLVEICEALNAANCVISTATVDVGMAELIARDDTGSVGSGVAGGTAANLLENDTLDGTAPPANKVDITILDDDGLSGVFAQGGLLRVPPGTAAGTYAVLIEVCEALNPTNCDTSVATVTVGDASLVAVDDEGAVASGNLGGVAVNVLLNDLLDGESIDPTDVEATVLSGGGISGLSLTATGDLVVPPGTPAGVFTAQVQVCELLNPANCDTSFATLTVGAGALVVQDDVGSVPSGRAGGVAVNLLANDTLDGAPLAPGQAVVFVIDTGGLADASVDLNGDLRVGPGTPAGTYTVLVEVCEALNLATNCASSIATVTVGAAILDAEDDVVFEVLSGPIGGVIPDVFTLFTIDGVEALPGELLISLFDDGGVPGLALDEDDALIVPAPTWGGIYDLTFEACEALNPTNCITVDVVLDVGDGTEVDTDGDGLSDFDEVYVYGTDPLNPDTDGDGCSDGDEVLVFGTDPLDPTDCGNGITPDTDAPADTDLPVDTDDVDTGRLDDTDPALEGPDTPDTADQPPDGDRPGTPGSEGRRIGAYSGGCACGVPGPPGWPMLLLLGWLPMRRRRSGGASR